MPSSRTSSGGEGRLEHVLALAGVVTLVALIAAAAACFAADEPQKLLDTARAQQEAGEVENAKLLYKQIVEQYPDTQQAGYAELALARLHADARENEEALAGFNRVFERYKDPRILGPAAWSKTSLLIYRFRDHEAAIEFAEEQLAAIGPEMSSYDMRHLLPHVMHACQETDQPEKAIETFNQHALTKPDVLNHVLIYEHLLDAQVKLGMLDEAATTARVAYALCDFEQQTIETASTLVKRAFTARGEIFKATQFFAAQEDPEKPNPLLEVPMPEVTEEQLAQMLEAARGYWRARMFAYLYAADYTEAMHIAQDRLGEAGAQDMVAALNEVARVFKARDLNLVRGNQFLSYAKSGEGENPLAGFWEEAE
jgi:hypothetical protein